MQPMLNCFNDILYDIFPFSSYLALLPQQGTFKENQECCTCEGPILRTEKTERKKPWELNHNLSISWPMLCCIATLADFLLIFSGFAHVIKISFNRYCQNVQIPVISYRKCHRES